MEVVVPSRSRRTATAAKASASPRQGSLSDAVLGARLRNARVACGFSLKTVEETSQGEISAAVLSSYERGEHAIPTVRLCLLSDLYHVSVGELTKHKVMRDHDAPEKLLRRLSDLPIRLDLDRIMKARGREVEAVARLASSVRERRHGKSVNSMVVRSADLEIVAGVLGQSIEALVGALAKAGALRRPTGRPPKDS